jgi:hypothetical protein
MRLLTVLQLVSSAFDQVRHSVLYQHRLELTIYSGGPAGAVYGFLFVWLGTACVFAVLSELASM